MKLKLSAFSDEAGASLLEQVNALRDNGIPYTELRSVDGKYAMDFTVDEAKEFRKGFNDNGVEIWALGSFIGKDNIDEINIKDYVDMCKKVYEVTLALGTNRVRAFSFFKAYNERNKVIDYLNALVEVAKEMGVEYYHENEKGIYGDNAERVLDILANVKGIKCVYDPANFIQVGEPSENTIKLIQPKTHYFHVKDVIAKTGEIVPAGYGDGNILEIVKRIDKDTTFTVEPHLSAFVGYSDRMDTEKLKNKFAFKDSREAFDKAIESIKGIFTEAGYKEIDREFVK